MAVGSSNDFDLVVLGAGTGGYAAAFRASQLGLKVALVDEDKLGGTCLHRGCIPTKALLESAAFNERLHRAADFGLNLGGETTIDYAKMAARRDMVVTRMWKGVQSLVKKYDVTWVQGRGRLDGATKVRVQMAGDDGTPGGGGERVLNATDVVLATGSRVKSLPGIEPDGTRIVTSDDVLRMDTLPGSVIIIGAGAVGVEFASMYHDLGSQVTLLEYLPAIVPLEDREVSKELERTFSRRGIKVITNARFDPESIKVDDEGVSITVGPEGKEATEVRAEMLLVAAGRATNVEDVGLETTSAEVDRGFVKVDDHMRTREPHLYAIGDIVGGLMLAHTAAHEGITAVHTIAGDPDVHGMDYDKQPKATYCRPEIASVGLTEQECVKRELPIKVAKVPFQAVGKAIIGGEYEGFAKIIANKETEETLGIHIIGPHATDLIAEASLAFTLEAVPWEIGLTTHAHPTLSEILGETAMAVDGRSINF
ncbi:MAG TPA: dihydrolipoyl dehydrogenase [Candidatus Limnocylindrales bacterium]|nr:dihydrolipoyl dehydrogenase [Candidatus Limnocylindrales bacterium]